MNFERGVDDSRREHIGAVIGLREIGSLLRTRTALDHGSISGSND
jgi:hypothetical protein